MLKATNIRNHYLALGSCCIKNEETWWKFVEDVFKRENITATPEHYQVLDCVRSFYLEKDRAPSVGEICSYTGIPMERFFTLFQDWLHTLFIVDNIVSNVLEIPIWNVEMFY